VVAIYASGAGPLLPTVRPVMRAELAKLKSQRDDMIIAPGKQSAARGYGRKMISSFFPSGLARRRRAKPEGKKEAGWEGSLPRAAASAALPGAIIMPPLRGSGEANPEPESERSYCTTMALLLASSSLQRIGELVPF